MTASTAAPPLPALQDAQGNPLRLGRELGRGGQGAVYEVQGQPELVAKVYLDAPDTAQIEKLEALVQARTPELDAVSTWPVTLLHTPAGRPRGFLMPRLNLQEARELHSLYSPGSRRRYFPQADWAFLVHVARNVARAFATLHAAGHLMGDVSGRNVVVTPEGTVRLIDTDSFQLSVAYEIYPCPVGTAEFTPPELQGRTFGELIRNENHDRFGLALLIFHLLFEGRHPYAGLHASGAMPSPAEAIAQHAFAYAPRPKPGLRQPPGTLNLSALPADLQSLIERAFSSTHEHRPAAQEWEAALLDLSQNLTTCTKNPQHKHYRTAPCPWCHLHRLIRRAAPISAALLTGRPQDVQNELQQLWVQLRTVKAPPPAQLTQLLGPFKPPPPLPLNLPRQPHRSRRVERQVENLKWAVRVTLTVILSWFVFILPQSTYFPLFFFPVLTLLLGWAVWSNLQKLDLDWHLRGYRNLEDRVLVYFIPRYARRQHYQQAVRSERRKVDAELQASLMALTLLEQRYHLENAHAEYQRDLTNLEERRERILKAVTRERDAVRALLERHQRRSLAQYLQAQDIVPGVIPNVGPSLIAHLHAQQVRTAYDLREERLRSLPPHWVQALLQWRASLEAFHQFDPGSVPQAELDEARRIHQQQAQAELRRLEQDVQRFKHATWGHNEADLLARMGELQTRVAQQQQALDTLDRLKV